MENNSLKGGVAAVTGAASGIGEALARHAVLAFSECLHLELAIKQAKVQMSAILPGPVKTKIFETVDDD